MHIRSFKWMEKQSFWLSALGHGLLLCAFILFIPHAKLSRPDKRPGLYVPSYVYQEPKPPSTAAQLKSLTKTAEKNGHEKTIPQQKIIRQSRQWRAVPISKTTEAVHLIGDESVKKPLLVLLGKALALHLIYPKIAVDFNLRGMVLVRFLLHPDGHITETQIVKTSHAGVLDDEAIAAVNAMSPVKNVNIFLTQPQFLVVGIIFG